MLPAVRALEASMHVARALENSGCVVESSAIKYDATDPVCTEAFTDDQLAGASFCYSFQTTISPPTRSARGCEVNAAAELATTTLEEGGFADAIGAVADIEGQVATTEAPSEGPTSGDEPTDAPSSGDDDEPTDAPTSGDDDEPTDAPTSGDDDEPSDAPTPNTGQESTSLSSKPSTNDALVNAQAEPVNVERGTKPPIEDEQSTSRNNLPSTSLTATPTVPSTPAPINAPVIVEQGTKAPGFFGRERRKLENKMMEKEHVII
jgi:hypothetical protein